MTKWRKDEVAQGRRAKPVDRHNGTARFLPSQVTVGGCRLPATKGRYLGIVEGAHQVRRTGREYGGAQKCGSDHCDSRNCDPYFT